MFGGGRDPDEIEIESADQGVAIRFGRGLEVFFLETLSDEMIDRVDRGLGNLNFRHVSFFRGDKCPVSFVVGALFQPEANGFNLFFGEMPVGVWRRHQVNVVIGCDPVEKFTVDTEDFFSGFT